MGILVILLLSCPCAYLLFIFIKKVWWTPIRIQSMMRNQGIKGPSYRSIYGSTKEIINMRKESLSKPMDLSHDMFPRIQPHVYSWVKLYGMNFLNWYGPQAQLIVTEPEMIKEIMNNKECQAKPEFQVYVKKLLGDGLVRSEGEKWAKMRKLANHAFHGDSLKSMIPEMIASAEMMLERWTHQEGKEMEIFEEFKLFTSEVISRTAFGSNYLQGQNIFEMLMKLVQIASRNAFKIRVPGIGKILRSRDDIESEKFEKEIQISVIEMIKNREKKVENGEVDNFGNDFLGLLVKANHDADEKKRISVQDMIDECKTFYIAGQETTSTMLAWTVLLLSIHTNWQEEARKEVLDIFGQHIPNSDGIARLKIMNMIIHESLRLYPPIPSLVRRVKREVRIGKLILPANLNLHISTVALHHDPHLWGEDVHLFKPERFSDGVAKASKNNMAAFLPFGMGPRNCVGLNFAATEAKIALSMILQRYMFTLSPAYVHSPFQLLTIRPQHGIQIFTILTWEMIQIVCGQAPCRGDVAPKVCQNCLENATKEIMNECQRKDAII